MTLPLTKEILRAAYDYLASTPPFKRWNLPEGEDVDFKLIHVKGSLAPLRWAWYAKVNGKHTIAISAARTGYTQSLMVLLAHEMIHLHEQQSGMATANQHTKVFWKLAARVCKIHGFDPKSF